MVPVGDVLFINRHKMVKFKNAKTCSGSDPGLDTSNHMQMCTKIHWNFHMSMNLYIPARYAAELTVRDAKGC
jgi:hypothetical protein